MKMTREQLEFAISQHLDGNLPSLEESALAEHLATDAQARALLEEYQALDQVLKRSMPLPDVSWDRFAAHVSRAVSAQDAPTVTYSLTAWRRAAGLALAACVLLVFGIAWLSYSGRNSRVASATRIAVVVGPQIEKTGNVEPIVEVAIGPAPSITESWRYSESVISRPAVVMIDRASRAVQDSETFW
jgi:negative regulator of sigma E activity